MEENSDTSKISVVAAWLAIAMTVVTLLLLMSLHILSPTEYPGNEVVKI